MNTKLNNSMEASSFLSTLNNEVRFIAVDKTGAAQYNAQSCDCDRCVIVMKERLILAEAKMNGEDGMVSLKEILFFDEELFSLRIEPKQEKRIGFVKLFHHPDGTINTIKYRFGEDYLFIFASKNNIIITKSVCDLTGEDDTPIPEDDPSVLFE